MSIPGAMFLTADTWGSWGPGCLAIHAAVSAWLWMNMLDQHSQPHQVVLQACVLLSGLVTSFPMTYHPLDYHFR